MFIYVPDLFFNVAQTPNANQRSSLVVRVVQMDRPNIQTNFESITHQLVSFFMTTYHLSISVVRLIGTTKELHGPTFSRRSLWQICLWSNCNNATIFQKLTDIKYFIWYIFSFLIYRQCSFFNSWPCQRTLTVQQVYSIQDWIWQNKKISFYLHAMQQLNPNSWNWRLAMGTVILSPMVSVLWLCFKQFSYLRCFLEILTSNFWQNIYIHHSISNSEAWTPRPGNNFELTKKKTWIRWFVDIKRWKHFHVLKRSIL